MREKQSVLEGGRGPDNLHYLRFLVYFLKNEKMVTVIFKTCLYLNAYYFKTHTTTIYYNCVSMEGSSL